MSKYARAGFKFRWHLGMGLCEMGEEVFMLLSLMEESEKNTQYW
jgi:uncharacterized protein YktB (UPF0637 family)